MLDKIEFIRNVLDTLYFECKFPARNEWSIAKSKKYLTEIEKELQKRRAK